MISLDNEEAPSYYKTLTLCTLSPIYTIAHEELHGRLVDTGLLEIDGSGRHLLTHTSDLKDNVNDMPAAETYREIVDDPSHTWPPETLVADAVAMGPAFAPGEDFRYSNTGYTVLALLAETVTGTSFGDAMQTMVLARQAVNAAARASRTEFIAL